MKRISTIFIMLFTLLNLHSRQALALADPLDRTWGFSLLATIPHLANLDVTKRFNNFLDLGATAGYIPINYQGVTFSVGNLNLSGRIFPFQGYFFLGLHGGIQTLAASANPVIDTGPQKVPTAISLAVNSVYLTPNLGWLWVFGTGFTFGLEAGLQIPVLPFSQFNVNITDPALAGFLNQVKATAQYQDIQTLIQNTSNILGQFQLPYFAVRLGWSF